MVSAGYEVAGVLVGGLSLGRRCWCVSSEGVAQVSFGVVSPSVGFTATLRQREP